MGSNFYTSGQVLNGSVTQLNFSFSLSAYHQHACELAVPAGCDFDMRLYNPSNSSVASALTRSTAGSNESFVYFNNGPLATFKIQVSRYSGNGTFSLSVVEIQKVVVDNLNPYTQPFNANYNATGLWACIANTNPWEVTNVDFHSSPTSIRLVGSGILPPVNDGTLASPLFDLTANYRYQITFGYLFWLGTGNLQVRVNDTGPWNNLMTLSGLTTAWTRAQANISVYRGSHVQFRFSLTGLVQTGYFYLDDLVINAYTPSAPAFSSPSLDPLTGNIYETFRVQIKYTNVNNIFPTDLYVSVWDDLVPNVKRVDLVEFDATDWDLTDGKQYICDLQVYDIDAPYLYCVSNQLVLPYALYNPLEFRYLRPNTSELLGSASFPYSLGFEAGSTYYGINDPVYVPPTIVANAYGHYYSTGTTPGAGSDNAALARIGIATPWISVNTELQAFLEFDLDFAEVVQLGVNALKINITADGTTWYTIAEYTGDFTGKPSINISAYIGENVSIRVFMESAVIAGLRTAEFTLDNVTTVEKDYIPPTMTNPSISDGQWLFGVWNVGMTVTDVGFGVDHIIVRVDGANLTTLTAFFGDKAEFSFDTAKYANGDHTVTIIVVDTSGNQNTYTIVVHIDNTPYWLYAVIAGVVAVLVIIAARKYKGVKTAVQRKVRKEAIPPTDVAKKILEVTNIFRRISAADLAKKIPVKGLTADTVLAYLRYMIAESMIKGDLDGDVFVRMMSGKMKAVLANKETAILDYMRGRKQASISEMIKDLHLEMIRKEALEDFIMGLVVAGKLACYFEEDTIFCEDEAAAKVKEPLPEPEPAPAPRPAPRAAMKKEVVKEAPKEAVEEAEEEATEFPAVVEKPVKKVVKEVKVPKEEKKQAPAPPKEEEAPAMEAEPKAEEPAKAPWTMADKKDDIIRLITSREHVGFDEIKKEFALHESTDEIEDYLFDLIKNRTIKGVIEDDGFSKRD